MKSLQIHSGGILMPEYHTVGTESQTHIPCLHTFKWALSVLSVMTVFPCWELYLQDTFSWNLLIFEIDNYKLCALKSKIFLILRLLNNN